ncbi:uncharacterized protein GGS25DRAFT_508036 [Hypoxylon fragiforme]|uniref:uncharacterized protein n=1 Tax=Hypoxylon fragiforme TaxID=63214 RepID=UPI0020C6CE73|nr:uncharacterized protein GGS25DRAFT_508036 [Hypoxylon fragiforme]KAI2604385.1 hypothetical protein GGS25DRAFT_508036 [Hypoxylon fragiforme]
MADKGKTTAAEGVEEPPAYTESTSANPTHTDDAPPGYEEGQTSTVPPISASPIYCTIPKVVGAYYQANLSGFKVFHIGASENELLFAVEVHMGYSMSGPLGVRPGIHLHNGPTTKDPMLAATSEETALSASMYSMNNNSIIYMPPPLLDRPGASTSSMVTEMMRARTTSDNGVAFSFSIEVGDAEKTRREKFEWKKITKKDKHAGAAQGGYKLLRLATGSSSPQGESSSSSLAATSSAASTAAASEDGGYEVVALLAWTKTISNLMHPFTIERKGSGAADVLGQRWALMVIITALRIWMLRVNGKTKRVVIAAGEKVRGKAAQE